MSATKEEQQQQQQQQEQGDEHESQLQLPKRPKRRGSAFFLDDETPDGLNDEKVMEYFAPTRPSVPWTRVILAGVDILRSPIYNKGLAFSEEERRVLHLRGLLPPTVVSQEQQIKRAMDNIRRCHSNLEKYEYLAGLLDRHERLFYRVLMLNLATLMPIVYTPTVGLACQQFGTIYRQAKGLYITSKDRGQVANVMRNWPSSDVRAIVVTDGERILGLGDLGASGLGIPIGKLALYTAIGGVHPRYCLPIQLDVGTDNDEIRRHPLYLGLQQKRDRSQAYDELIEEFVISAREVFGSRVLIQFEDFANRNALRLLRKYKDRCTTFNDDIQGTASVVLAGLFAALRATQTKWDEHRILMYGAGSAGLGIANLAARAMSIDLGEDEVESRKRIFLVDSRGLVTKDRPSGGVSEDKAPFACALENETDLAAIVRLTKATCIIGVTANPNSFTEDVLKAMTENSKQPLVFALSNPTSKAECTAEDAYKHTNGTCLFASGSPFDSVEFNGKLHVPGQGNNAYIFPGVGHGIICCGARRVPEEIFVHAARTLAAQVRDEDLEKGLLYPPLADIRKVSMHVAAATCEVAYDHELASRMPRPENMLEFVSSQAYRAHYPDMTG
eukprot:TRINITY_DN65761_c9_g2_i1.p1 TRINITY_DN65761_c9_g2~~TRINITY_DN65761_c9_g2_i1.p1  ORF type:complete len:631 (-),score=380.64 TRINITY_DN65761_c9_g2_i1:40-1884(-)